MEKNDVVTNVAVFIDYENVYKTLLYKYTNVLRLAFFEKLRIWCKDNAKRIVKMAVYCNFDNKDLHESYHQSILQLYGVETIHTANQGKNYADLKITIDVMTSIYSNNNIDEFFIMTNDKDMTPLLNIIRANKRNVSIITTSDSYNETLVAFSDNHIKLEGIVAIPIEHKVLDDITQNFWNKYRKYIDDNIVALLSGRQFKHYGLEYNLDNEIAYSKIMIYELANIILDSSNRGEVVFYNYEYMGKKYLAMIPSDVKDELIENNAITESDIVHGYDIGALVKSTYDKYISILTKS